MKWQTMSLEERWSKFLEFHEDNPQVYQELVSLARRVVGRGHQHYGMHCLFEVVRFHRDVGETTDAKFKLNNNLIPFYARFVMECESDLDGLFELRAMKAFAKTLPYTEDGSDDSDDEV